LIGPDRQTRRHRRKKRLEDVAVPSRLTPSGGQAAKSGGAVRAATRNSGRRCSQGPRVRPYPLLQDR
jgi:hypothetical protein